MNNEDIGDDPRGQCRRTNCDCVHCRVPCKHMPGALIPGDLERIAEHEGETLESTEWLQKHFVASEGFQAVYAGELVRCPTIVPAQKPDGSCVFLEDDTERCTIHRVAPFGCAYHDMHMQKPEADRASTACAIAQMRAVGSQEGTYFDTLKMLYQAGLVAPPLAERRGNLQQELDEVEEQYGEAVRYDA